MGWMTGLEPAASRATIWRSSQLNYTHHISGYYGRPRRVERLDFHYWSWRQESNLQPADYKSAALPLSHASMLRTFAVSTPSGLLLIAT